MIPSCRVLDLSFSAIIFVPYLYVITLKKIYLPSFPRR